MTGMLPYSAIEWLAPQIRALDRKTNAASVLVALVKFADHRNGFAFPTQRQIAAISFGLPEEQVCEWQVESMRKAIKDLVDRGLVEIVQKGIKGRATRYKICWSSTSGSAAGDGDSPRYPEGERSADGSPCDGAEIPLGRVQVPPAKRPDSPVDVPGTNSQFEGPFLISQTRPATLAAAADSSFSSSDGGHGIGDVDDGSPLLDFDFGLNRGQGQRTTDVKTGVAQRGARGGASAQAPNRYAGACLGCGGHVGVGAGTWAKDTTGKSRAHHLTGDCVAPLSIEEILRLEPRERTRDEHARVEAHHHAEANAWEAARLEEQYAEERRRAALTDEERAAEDDADQREKEEMERRLAEMRARVRQTPGVGRRID
ncbi:hypothetical protein F0U44_02800 [Nocardioides humilatus]|uniref:Uncharacterized protein n=1 Tax=Nocardioides humilatus TaxID=2607660 RepID=A0A5B1LME5_9ACTN|nr:hypothetical protein [Nocardioides humilatus]KAA1421258.1 hypothetical protein F0U44_02800 [Nocardioides humilatus]